MTRYTFTGHFEVSPPLEEKHVRILKKFRETVHGDRETDTPYIIENSMHCLWDVDEKGTVIYWKNEEGEKEQRKFVHWIHHINTMFLISWERTLEGVVQWTNENEKGYIVASMFTDPVTLKNKTDLMPTV
jgi:hypothetical protein